MDNLSLLCVNKPARYVGGEYNSVRRSKEDVNWVLVYPDVYEVGMSSFGLQILYNILNSKAWIRAERCFAPFPDYEEFLRSRNEPLTSLESRTPLSKFDVVGMSITTELNYTNVLLCLDMGGIPLKRDDRKTFPLVIAGGPTCVNPLPLERFFDAFFIGDGEEGVIEISEIVREGKRKGLTKSEVLKELSKVVGVYVPGVSKTFPVKRRVIPDIELSPHPLRPVIPNVSAVHDRAVVEIARGCTKGCRFCLAGFITRPVRERSPENVIKITKEILDNTGYEQLSFLSLNTCDYTRINELVLAIADYLERKKISLSLPSIRVGTLSEGVLNSITKIMRTGITLAPETGSERLRRVINKPFTNEELMRDVDAVLKYGWEHLKLYFMIGLPEETDEDREEIVRVVEEILKIGRKASLHFHLSVHISQFVPKPHTPFQWERQMGVEETFEILKFLKRKVLAKKEAKVKYQFPYISFIEGILARGDQKIGGVIEKAYLYGARFDGWTEFFKKDAWKVAFSDEGIDPLEYLRERKKDDIPWGIIDTGVSSQFLAEERERALKGDELNDCFRSKCYGCGVCDFKGLKPIFRSDLPLTVKIKKEVSGFRFKFRLKITKEGSMRFLGYTDYTVAFERGMRRSGLPLAFTKGYHPRPRFSYGFPPPVGVESHSEYVDIELEDRIPPEEVFRRLSGCMPEGIRVLKVEEIPLGKPSIFSSTYGFVYRFYSDNGRILNAINVDKFSNGEYRKFLSGFKRGDRYFEIVIKVKNGKTVNPYTLLKMFTGHDMKDEVKVLRKEVLLK